MCSHAVDRTNTRRCLPSTPCADRLHTTHMPGLGKNLHFRIEAHSYNQDRLDAGEYVEGTTYLKVSCAAAACGELSQRLLPMAWVGEICPCCGGCWSCLARVRG